MRSSVIAGDDQRTQAQLRARGRGRGGPSCGRSASSPAHVVAVMLAERRRGGRRAVRRLAGRCRLPAAQPAAHRRRGRARSWPTCAPPPSSPRPSRRLAGIGMVPSTVGPRLRTDARRPGRALRRRHRADPVHVGHDRPPKAVLLRHSGVLELLDGVLANLRGLDRCIGRRAGDDADAEPDPGVAVAVGRHLQRAVRAAGRRADRGARPLHARAVRRGRAAVRHPLDRAAPGGHDHAGRRSRRRSTSRRCATCAASPRRCRRCRPGASATSSASPCSTATARPRSAARSSGGTRPTRAQWGETKLGSVGRPHEGVTVRAVDADGRRRCAPTSAGELWVETPALSAGYADGADLGDRLTADGWFRTGDVGRVDADGFVWIEGRVSDMINRGGLKVFPGEVAEVLRWRPRWPTSRWSARPTTGWARCPWAFVVPPSRRRPASSTAAALAELCRAHLAPYKVPVRFVAVDALPRNEIGKVLVAELVAEGRVGARERRSTWVACWRGRPCGPMASTRSTASTSRASTWWPADRVRRSRRVGRPTHTAACTAPVRPPISATVASCSARPRRTCAVA